MKILNLYSGIGGNRRLWVKEQTKIIEMLSNKKIIRGLTSALEDFKKGKYIVLTN